MNRNKLKQYAPQARCDCIVAVTDRAAYYGLTRDRIAPITEQGDVVIIAGKPFPRNIASKRKGEHTSFGRCTRPIERWAMARCDVYGRICR